MTQPSMPHHGESDAARIKRLAMRSWRRGTKEMDLILGPFADAHLATLSEVELRAYDALLSENDQDLYLWITGARVAPSEHAPLIARIGDFARLRMR